MLKILKVRLGRTPQAGIAPPQGLTALDYPEKYVLYYILRALKKSETSCHCEGLSPKQSHK